jgi:hypothetical protein
LREANVAQLAIGSIKPVKRVPTAMISAQCIRRCVHDSQPRKPKRPTTNDDITMLAGTAFAIGENGYGAVPGFGFARREPSGSPVSMENSTTSAVAARIARNTVQPTREGRSDAALARGRSISVVIGALPCDPIGRNACSCCPPVRLDPRAARGP